MGSERMPSGRLPMDIDLYIPVFTVLQFLFYMGLLKVAEQLSNHEHTHHVSSEITSSDVTSSAMTSSDESYGEF